MARKNNNRTSRRSTNVAARPSLHRRPQVRSFDPVTFNIRRARSSLEGRLPARRPAVDDLRTYHPLGEARPVYRASGVAASYAKRLYDAPRAIRSGFQKASPLSRARHAVQRSVARGVGAVPGMDRATRAVRVFQHPLSIPLCHARRIRREVLHALKIAGSGVGKPKFTERSSLRC